MTAGSSEATPAKRWPVRHTSESHRRQDAEFITGWLGVFYLLLILQGE
jgi:hypothetical protein